MTPGRPYGAVIALAVTAFCYGTTENLPIGLLNLIGSSIESSPARTGLLVTGYGLMVAVVSVPLTRLTARVPRRKLLLVLLTVFVVSTLASAVATTFGTLLAARVVTGLSHAVFWAVGPVAGAALFPSALRGRAATIVFAGGSMAIVMGVPLGTWLGQRTSWRISFLALTAVGLVALAALAALLPDDAEDPSTGTAPTPDRAVYLRLVAMVGLAMTGFFSFFTYITVYLTETAGFSASAVSPILLAHGLCDIVGLLIAGAVVDRYPHATLRISLVLLSAAQLALFVAPRDPVTVIVLLGLVGSTLPAMVSGMQLLTLRHAPGDLSVASAGTSAAFNVGIAAGSLGGGLLLARAGPAGLPLVGAGFALAALAVAPVRERPMVSGR